MKILLISNGKATRKQSKITSIIVANRDCISYYYASIKAYVLV